MFEETGTHAPSQGAVPWPTGAVEKAATIRRLLTVSPELAKQHADELATEFTQAIRLLVYLHCRRINHIGLVDDAVQNASMDVLHELSSGNERKHLLIYLRGVISNAVNRTVTARGAMHPTAQQRRIATLNKAAGLYLADNGEMPNEYQLRDAQVSLMSSRADARTQAELSSIEEIRAYMNGDAPFIEDGQTASGTEHNHDLWVADHHISESDHLEEELALDPVDVRRLIGLTADACARLHPKIDGPRFAIAVMVNTMYGTMNELRLARDFDLTRSVVRTAVGKVWTMAATVAEEQMGITSVRVNESA